MWITYFKLLAHCAAIQKCKFKIDKNTYNFKLFHLYHYLEYSRDIFGFCANYITLGNWTHMKYFAVKERKKNIKTRNKLTA